MSVEGYGLSKRLTSKTIQKGVEAPFRLWAVMQMDTGLQGLRASIGVAFARKARKVALASRYVKVLLVLGGALLAGACAVFGSGPIWPLTVAQILGIFGSLLAFAGGFFVAFVEDDSAEELDQSRRALDEAIAYERQSSEILDQLFDYEDAVNRLTSLYTSVSVGRGMIEQGLSANVSSEVDLVGACLKTMKSDLKVTLGFALTDFWTIAIYQAVESGEPGGRMLRCVAHDRSVDCEINDARTWPLGVGVGGITLAKNDEVVVPDLADDKVGTAFRLDKSLIKSQDSERYRSMFAVPISVGQDKNPWGVAMATSNQPSHFGSALGPGVKPEEAVRALAGFSALAIEVSRSNSRAKNVQAPETVEKDL